MMVSIGDLRYVRRLGEGYFRTIPAAPDKPDLAGHPRALAFLFSTEMWERFSYYGMRSLLVLYMVNYLFAPERFDTVIGLAALKRMHEAVSGPLDVQPFSSLLYGDYTMLVYLTPIFGGLLADQLLGHRRRLEPVQDLLEVRV